MVVSLTAHAQGTHAPGEELQNLELVYVKGKGLETSSTDWHFFVRSTVKREDLAKRKWKTENSSEGGNLLQNSLLQPE